MILTIKKLLSWDRKITSIIFKRNYCKNTVINCVWIIKFYKSYFFSICLFNNFVVKIVKIPIILSKYFLNLWTSKNPKLFLLDIIERKFETKKSILNENNLVHFILFKLNYLIFNTKVLLWVSIFHLFITVNFIEILKINAKDLRIFRNLIRNSIKK